MRLIDADYVLNALGIFNDRENGNEHFLNGIETAMEIIEQAPTINATIRKPRESRRKLPCTCGNKHISMWYGFHTNQCICDDCGKQGPKTFTEIDAIRGWNKLIEEGEHEAD